MKPQEIDVKKIKAVFFDAGGTLFRPYPSVGEIYAETALRHGLAVEAGRAEAAFQAKWHERDGRAAEAVRCYREVSATCPGTTLSVKAAERLAALGPQ